MTDDEADMYYDKWLSVKAKNKKLEDQIERLRSDISRLEKDCRKLYEELAERDQWY